MFKKLLWIIGLAVVVAAVVVWFAFPGFFNRSIKGSGAPLPHTTAVSAQGYTLVIRDIQLTGAAMAFPSVVVNDAQEPGIVITTEQNLYDELTVTVDEAAKTVTIAGNARAKFSTANFKIQIGRNVTTVQLDSPLQYLIDLTQTPDFSLKVKGLAAGSVNMVNGNSFSMSQTGGGKATLTGDCAKATFTVKGLADTNAENFVTQITNIDVTGGSTNRVHATRELHATVNGAGTVTYHGNPPNVVPVIKGVGKISPAN